MRYLKEEDEATYEDPARGRVDAFRSVPGTSTGWWTGSMARLLPSWKYRLLERLLREQCHVGIQDGRSGGMTTMLGQGAGARLL